jgi:hypothetical protein
MAGLYGGVLLGLRNFERIEKAIDLHVDMHSSQFSVVTNTLTCWPLPLLNECRQCPVRVLSSIPKLDERAGSSMMLCRRRAEVFLDSTCIPNKGHNQMHLHDSDEREFAVAVSRHTKDVSHQSGLEGGRTEYSMPRCMYFNFKLSNKMSFLDPIQIFRSRSL